MSDEFFSGLFSAGAAGGAGGAATVPAATAGYSAGATAGATAYSSLPATTSGITAAQVGTYAGYATAALQLAQGLSGAAVMGDNAGLATEEAKQAKILSQAEADRERRLNVYRQSQFTAGAGAQGTTFEGSPMLVYLANAKEAAINEADIEYGGELKARGLRRQSDIYRKMAGAQLASGLVAGGTSLGSTLLRS